MVLTCILLITRPCKPIHNDGFISDFCDAALFKEHPLFKNDKHALQIVAYYDEVETANCLGSHAGHNSKLGKFINEHAILCHRKHLSVYRYVLLYFGQSEDMNCSHHAKQLNL